MIDLKGFLSHLIYKTVGTLNFARQIEWQNMLEWLDPREGERILDVACGGGRLSLKIAEKGCKVYGIDISEDSINTAKRLAEREKINAHYEIADAQHLPYSGGYFDKVVCSSSLEHFPDDVESLKEMNRILKQGGTLVLTTDSCIYLNQGSIGERHRDIAHIVNYYTPEILKERFEIAGLVIVKIKYLLKSPITRFFINIGIKMAWRGYLWLGISLLAYPLCLLSERLFKTRELGYVLIAEAKNNLM